MRPALAFLPLAALAGFAVSPGSGWCTLAAAMSLQIAFAVIVSRKMFTSCATLLDPRIVAVVPVAIFMVYYETFWFFHGLFTPFRFKK